MELNECKPHVPFRSWQEIDVWEETHKELVAEYERKGEEL